MNVHGAKECADCGVVFSDIRGGRGAPKQRDNVDRTCPWNDHGQICGLVGSLSDATNGSGPWYCARHYWQLKGWPQRASDDAHISYRERHYAEIGKPYKPPVLGDIGHWRSVGQLAPPPRHREPGDDDEPIMQA